MSRANYYKDRQKRQHQEIAEDRVVEQVNKVRRSHPRMGTRKVLYEIGDQLRSQGINLGRDRLFELLGRRGLLIKPLPKKPKTTNSRHCLPVCKNLIKDLKVTRANQVWVSDITYIAYEQNFLYLALTSDLKSRKILGFDISTSLDARGAIRAAQMALRQLPQSLKVIHHSDRGCQYCCHEFVKLFKDRGEISMTEVNHCYENSLAERINGILKQEYGLRDRLPNKAMAIKMVQEAIHLYNTSRPHAALGYAYPSQVHALAE